MRLNRTLSLGQTIRLAIVSAGLLSTQALAPVNADQDPCAGKPETGRQLRKSLAGLHKRRHRCDDLLERLLEVHRLSNPRPSTQAYVTGRTRCVGLPAFSGTTVLAFYVGP